MPTDLLKDLPRWVLVLASVVGVLAIGAIGTWSGAELRTSTATNQSQSERLIDHEARLRALESSNVRIEAKIDRILERLGAN